MRQGSKPLGIDSNLDEGAKPALSAAEGACPTHSRGAARSWFSIPTPLRPAWRSSIVSPPECAGCFPARESPDSRPQPAGCARRREAHSMIRAAAQASFLSPTTKPCYSDGTISQTVERKRPGLTYLLGVPFCAFPAQYIGHHAA